MTDSQSQWVPVPAPGKAYAYYGSLKDVPATLPINVSAVLLAPPSADVVSAEVVTSGKKYMLQVPADAQLIAAADVPAAKAADATADSDNA